MGEKIIGLSIREAETVDVSNDEVVLKFTGCGVDFVVNSQKPLDGPVPSYINVALAVAYLSVMDMAWLRDTLQMFKATPNKWEGITNMDELEKYLKTSETNDE